MRSLCRQIAPLALATALALIYASTGRAVVVWDEGPTFTNDLSNNGNAPTQINLAAGTNSVIGGVPGSDLDFLTIHVPANHEFTALRLAAFSGGGDGTAFIGMKFGTTIAVTGNPAQLNGYTHFGTGPGNVGQDILDNIGTGPGSVGFTPPLPTGAYSFWIQQASAASTTYQFDFEVAALAPPGVPGDYNGNNVVDAADYAVWRDSVDQTGAGLPADGNNDEVVNQADYDFWRARFGNTDAVGAGSTSIPEPGAAVPILCLIVAAIRLRARQRIR